MRRDAAGIDSLGSWSDASNWQRDMSNIANGMNTAADTMEMISKH